MFRSTTTQRHNPNHALARFGLGRSVEDPVFVFGSNLAGRHGAGAALYAKKFRGAVYGKGEGLQGESYAIPTKDGRNLAVPLTHPSQVLSIREIAEAVGRFLQFARQNRTIVFEVTPIGCGAGFTPPQIAPLFRCAPANCRLPAEFVAELAKLEQAPAEDETMDDDIHSPGN